MAHRLGVSQSTVKLWSELLGLPFIQGQQENERCYDAESLQVLETVKNLRKANRGYKTIVKVIHFNKDRQRKQAENLSLMVSSAPAKTSNPSGEVLVEYPSPPKPVRKLESEPPRTSPSPKEAISPQLMQLLKTLEKRLYKLEIKVQPPPEIHPETERRLLRLEQALQEMTHKQLAPLQGRLDALDKKLASLAQTTDEKLAGMDSVVKVIQNLERMIRMLDKQLHTVENALEKVITHQEGTITQEELEQFQQHLQQNFQQPITKLARHLAFVEKQQEEVNQHVNKVVGQYQYIKDNMLAKEQVARQFSQFENKLFELAGEMVQKHELEQKFTVIVEQNEELQQKVLNKLQNSIDRYELNERLYPLIETQEALRKDILFLKTLNSELMQRNIALETRQVKRKPAGEQHPPQAYYQPQEQAAPPQPDTNIAIYRSLGVDDAVNEPDERVQPIPAVRAMRNLEQITHKLSRLEEKLRIKDDKVSLLENYVLKHAGQPKTFMQKLRTFMET